MKRQQRGCFGLRQNPGEPILRFVDCWTCKAYNLKVLPLAKHDSSHQQT